MSTSKGVEQDLSFERLLRELGKLTEEQQLKWFSSFMANMKAAK